MPKKILIVDDDDELCAEITEILTDEGFSVERAADGVTAEKKIKSYAYDVILLDFKIPAPSGMEILRKLKDMGNPAKIYLTSGRPFIEKLLQEEGVQESVCGVFSKPFDIIALLKEIKS